MYPEIIQYNKRIVIELSRITALLSTKKWRNHRKSNPVWLRGKKRTTGIF